MGKGLRKLIHKKYHTVSINEYNISRICCKCSNRLNVCYDENNDKVYRLLSFYACMRSDNKNITYRIRDKNAAINMILNLTREWILRTQRRVRPECFNLCYLLRLFHLPSTSTSISIVVRVKWLNTTSLRFLGITIDWILTVIYYVFLIKYYSSK